ncbi:MAG TPA: ABC transporter ATP-binding protein [Candidatus Goldiibacteriota bacterium]|nr:ABC transporter ATP-binding protein [Candidatus Goldiibacteriota bacterium]HRQ44582.1 ABC transporter ATP-binding protein [Candidatus Goldiibacteriota bacterium]
MIKIEKLVKKYGDFTAVKGLDLQVKQGEIFGFLGPNGAGKTSTIKMMTGLTEITSGSACIDGVCLSKDPVGYKRKFSLIPDNPYMFEKLRGIEFVEFVANLYGVDKEHYKKQYDRYVEVFGVADFINDFIESYSHGMSQKLLIVAAMIHSPKVLILDEPMVGLDPKSMRILKNELKSAAKEGMTVFMSTHSMETAEETCDTVGIIDKGELLISGTVQDIKNANRTERLEDLFFMLTDKNNIKS